MKIDARSQGDFLGNPKKYKAVLLYGPDEGLIRERRKAIAARSGGEGNPLGPTELSAEQVASDPGLLHESLSSLSLLGEPPPVILRGAGDRLTETLKSALSEPTSNFLIVTGGDLPKKSSLRAFFEAEKHLAALACYADEAQTIEQVARAFFTRHGIRVEGEVFAYLRSHLGNDRAVTLSELEKLRLYLGEETMLSAEAVSALLGDNKTVEADELAHAALERDTRRAYRLADTLLEEGNAPIMLLRNLARHVERVLQLKTLIAGGLPADRAMMALRPPVFFKERDRMKRQAGRVGMGELERMLGRLLEAEIACKRGVEPALLLKSTVASLR